MWKWQKHKIKHNTQESPFPAGDNKAAKYGKENSKHNWYKRIHKKEALPWNGP